MLATMPKCALLLSAFATIASSLVSNGPGGSVASPLDLGLTDLERRTRIQRLPLAQDH